MLRGDYLRAQNLFYDAYEALPLDESRLLSFDAYTHGPPHAASGVEWIAFDVIARGHLLHLVNMLNRTYMVTRHVEAWDVVLDQLDEQAKTDLLWNVVSPIAEGLLGTPHVVRNRFVYGAVMLLREGARIAHDESAQSIDESDVGYAVLTEGRFHDFAERHGIDVTALAERVSRLNTSEVRDYRSGHHLTLPPDIDFGASPLVTPHAKHEEVAYGFSGTEPFQLPEIVGLMHDEHEKALAAFGAFWDFACDLTSSLEERGGGRRIDALR